MVEQPNILLDSKALRSFYCGYVEGMGPIAYSELKVSSLHHFIARWESMSADVFFALYPPGPRIMLYNWMGLYCSYLDGMTFSTEELKDRLNFASLMARVLE